MTVFAKTTPAMPTRDIERALEFYEGVLGFESDVREGDFALLRRDDATLTLWGATDESWQERTEWGTPVCSGAESFIAGTASFRLQVDGIEELYARCREHVHPNAPLHETEWRTREFGVLDPDGNLIGVWEPQS